MTWTDPAEQTSSDDEVETIHAEPYVPVSKRWHKFRLWKDESGYWIAMQPVQADCPLFRSLFDSRPMYGFGHQSYERVLDELRLAVHKGDAALHLQEALQ